jgi:hypothetical protein
MVVNQISDCSSSTTMLRLFSVALSLFLSLQLAIADPPSTGSFPRHAKASSLVKQSLISALLLPRGKFNARAADACPSGYREDFLKIPIKYHEVLTLF